MIAKFVSDGQTLTDEAASSCIVQETQRCKGGLLSRHCLMEDTAEQVQLPIAAFLSHVQRSCGGCLAGSITALLSIMPCLRTTRPFPTYVSLEVSKLPLL